MVWNPTNQSIDTTIDAPMYYAGLSAVRGVTAAMVAEKGENPAQVALGRNDTVQLTVSLQPRQFTWFVISEV